MARRSLAVAALLGLLTLLLLVPTAHGLSAPVAAPHPPIWDTGAAAERYVSTGDSFASGPGIQPLRPGGCSRSERNYATLVAQALDVAAFTDASCGGAQTKHFTEAQGTNPPQFDALGPDTTLVTFGTMGGNDVGLVGLATSCAFDDCVPASGTDPLAEKFAALEAALTNDLAEAKRRAPHAAIVVVGYGTYVLTEGCPNLEATGVTAAEAAYLQSQIDRLSDLLGDVAAADVTFADMRDIPGSLDHTVCAAPDEQWIRAVNTYDDGAPFHPSTAGMAATAGHLLGIVRAAIEKRGPVTLPPPAQPKPTKKERRDALRKKAAKARLTVTCTGARPAHRKVRMQVRRGGGAVDRVVFRLGGKKLATDRRAPYRLQRKAAKVKRHKGQVRAVVTFRDRDVTVKRTIVKKRPRCLR